ncbi:MAG: ABC transporter ATP-binding protein [Chloroflexi bacterium]|nr:MAG: ABC transporter ATP-binding protein [Chloroflexota bacterium]
MGVVKAVDGVSLEVYRGEVLGLVGESGCGKSTLGMALLRLVRPPGRITQGTILFDGINLLSLSEGEMRDLRGRRISMIFQDPMTSLDVIVEAQFLDLLKELQEAYQLTIILITHNIGIVAELADRVAVMYAGKLVELAPAVPLFTEPLHPYTMGLLRSVPNIRLEQDRLEIMEGSPLRRNRSGTSGRLLGADGGGRVVGDAKPLPG